MTLQTSRYQILDKHTIIDMFITYLNIELKRTKLTSHIDTKLMYMSDQYRSRDDNCPDNLYLSGNYRDMNITSSFLM
jgi:hypothetical protein